MDWTQAFAIMGVFIAAFLYMMSRMDSNQKQTNEKIEGINHRLTTLEVETKFELRNVNQRITDFQGQVNQRLSTIEGYLVPRKVFHFEEPEHKDDPKEN